MAGANNRMYIGVHECNIHTLSEIDGIFGKNFNEVNVPCLVYWFVSQ